MFVAMATLNSWWPAQTYTANFGQATSAGVIALYALFYSTAAAFTMYLMGGRVWVWGKRHNLSTQPEMYALRFNSKAIQIISAIIGIVGQMPWVVVSLVTFGYVFYAVSNGSIPFSIGILIGTSILLLRQYYTISMGMRGLIYSDLIQGLMAYVVGAIFLVYVGVKVFHGFDMGHIFKTHPQLSVIPVSKKTVGGPWYFMAITLTGALGGFAWPAMFNKMYTASSVKSIKRSVALFTPISAMFFILLVFVAILSGSLPHAQSDPQGMYFTVAKLAAGSVGLGLASVIVLSAAMGSVDANIQSNGIELARDIFSTINPKITPDKQIFIAKVGMWALILIAVIISNMKLPSLIVVAIIAYQGIVQLVPVQMLGLFWRRGTAKGAVFGTLSGFVVAIVFQILYPVSIPWLGGITSGIVGLIVNVVVFVTLSLMFPNSIAEQARVDDLFAEFAYASTNPTSQVAEIR